MALFGKKRSVDKKFKKFQTNFPDAMFIGHHPGGILEIHPEAGLTEGQYRRYSRGLVVDTHHLRRSRRDGSGGPVTRDWRQFINALEYKQVKMIHLHSEGEELKHFLDWKENELTKMLKSLKDFDCPLVVEVPPLIHPSINKAIERMTMIRTLIRTHTGAY